MLDVRQPIDSHLYNPTICETDPRRSAWTLSGEHLNLERKPTVMVRLFC